MAKSTIILADTDVKFLAPLELKFIEELDENIDLEVITDPDYFNEYFSGPKTANILVVSEELYTTELQKQNINNIYVLTENTDEGGTEDLVITKIFKYTSTQEIYKQITATSKVELDSKKEKETKVILVYSASGGVGKTTIGLGVSNAMAKTYNNVLYINAQRINSFQHYLKNKSTIPSNVISEFTNKEPNLFGRINHIIRNENFNYLPPFGMALSSLNLDATVFIELIKSAKATKQYDAIVVDTDSVFNKKTADLITMADKVIITLNQTRQSVYATNMLLKNISCNDNEKYYFVCNDFDEDNPNALTMEEYKPNFMVNEYIKHFDKFDEKSLDDIAKESDIQKIAYLIV